MRKKIDNRIRTLIENNVYLGHRSLFVIVGDKGRDQVVILHHVLSKATVRARPTVLWCYKKDLGFSRKKRMRQLQKKMKFGKINIKEDDPFELFIASTTIRYCYYNETHKILGNTFGFCVLQDFEAITPNLLARTIETVEGGGIIVILLKSVTSLKQIFALSMDVHARYRTESHKDIVCRFNERFILSLATCKKCIVMDDQFNILPISSHILDITPLTVIPDQQIETNSDRDLKNLKVNLEDTQPVGCLVNLCKTLDQAKAVLQFIDVICEKSLNSTVALTSARGRGKSAALGLALAGAIAFGYSNMFVTSPSPENLNTLFEFVFKGFDALKYEEHIDYEILQSTNPDFHKAVIKYIHPGDAKKLEQAELLLIDEAAAIPLPLVENLLGSYLVFMASTVNGYEGTGRSLSLKLIQKLRQKSTIPKTNQNNSHLNRSLHEISLKESIRYKVGDGVEQWLNDLLCLDVTNSEPVNSKCPLPQDCDLYYINRDTLFSFHHASELFLKQIMSLYVSSHYKNTPNDLQMMSDAPAHHLFCLLGPTDPEGLSLPEVCLEGELSKDNVLQGISQYKKASGDLIPWSITQQFQDKDFASLSGARIVRIATHPNYQSMGYGSHAVEILTQYYEGNLFSLEEKHDFGMQEIQPVLDEDLGLLQEEIIPRKKLPPLLLKLNERSAEPLDYIGVCFGLNESLLKFWKKSGFIPVYLRQTTSDLTGEHSCIMLKTLTRKNNQHSWLPEFYVDFKRRFLSLLSFSFCLFPTSLVLSMINNNLKQVSVKYLDKNELLIHFTPYDLKRLQLYCNNMADYHLITDLLPTLGHLIFQDKLENVHFSLVQQAILAGLGLQRKTVDNLATELNLPASQLLGILIKTIRRATNHLIKILEEAEEKNFIEPKISEYNPLSISLQEELEQAAKKIEIKQKEETEKLLQMDLSQYAIRGTEEDWSRATIQNGIVKLKRTGSLSSYLNNSLKKKKKKK